MAMLVAVARVLALACRDVGRLGICLGICLTAMPLMPAAPQAEVQQDRQDGQKLERTGHSIFSVGKFFSVQV